MPASAPTNDVRARKVRSTRKRLVFPFLSSDNTNTLEFGHILASSCQRLCVQSCISPLIGFRRAFARRSAAVSRAGTQRSWYGTY
jgi:hypothetical protein